MRTWTDEQLIEAFKYAESVAHILRSLGLRAAGGNYKLVKERMNALGLDKSSLKGQAWSRGKNFSPRRPIEEYLVANKWSNSDRLRKRLISEGLKERKCESCGLITWLNKPIPLELDHIDGVRYNNIIENLRLLCPNCHAQTDTYRGKNQQRAGVAKRQTRNS